MAYTTIDDPTAYFNTSLYAGTGAAHNIIGTGFQPDLVWIKERSSTSSHLLNDSSRGAGENMYPDTTASEGTNTTLFTSFNSDGFTVGDTGQANDEGETYVAWQWKCNGGTTTTNDASATSVGNVDSVYQTNTTARFSIVTYTGTASDDSVLAHGLGASPELIIIKARSATTGWSTNHISSGITSGYYQLQDTTAFTSADNNVKAVSSTTFTLGVDSWVNGSGVDFVAYFFKGVQGYSKFGGYTGNGNADGVFLYTGFKPSMIIIKHSSGTSNWSILDTTRDPTNVNSLRLFPDDNAVENSGLDSMDMLSNGIKIRSNDAGHNSDGETYIYMAFAASPFVTSNGVPTNAR